MLKTGNSWLVRLAYMILICVCAYSLMADEVRARERFITPVPFNFYYAWQAPENADRQDFREYVKKGETVESWTHLVTRQVLPGKSSPSPKEMVSGMAAGFKASCEKASAKLLGEELERGLETTSAILVCEKRKSSGASEITLVKVIRGHEALYVMQRAWSGELLQPQNKAALNDSIAVALLANRAVFVCGETERESGSLCPQGFLETNGQSGQACGFAGLVRVEAAGIPGMQQPDVIFPLYLSEQGELRDPEFAEFRSTIGNKYNQTGVLLVPLHFAKHDGANPANWIETLGQGALAAIEVLQGIGVKPWRISLGYNPECLERPNAG